MLFAFLGWRTLLLQWSGQREQSFSCSLVNLQWPTVSLRIVLDLWGNLIKILESLLCFIESQFNRRFLFLFCFLSGCQWHVWWWTSSVSHRAFETNSCNCKWLSYFWTQYNPFLFTAVSFSVFYNILNYSVSEQILILIIILII